MAPTESGSASPTYAEMVVLPTMSAETYVIAMVEIILGNVNHLSKPAT